MLGSVEAFQRTYKFDALVSVGIMLLRSAADVSLLYSSAERKRYGYPVFATLPSQSHTDG